mmetsp:Transcript_3307/g.5755  ORF Transcript_3307/g.5755 Transcript_3307/m.5755 type:complete len:243 (-) Transcript_3307:118-846(-)
MSWWRSRYWFCGRWCNDLNDIRCNRRRCFNSRSCSSSSCHERTAYVFRTLHGIAYIAPFCLLRSINQKIFTGFAPYCWYVDIFSRDSIRADGTSCRLWSSRGFRTARFFGPFHLSTHVALFFGCFRIIHHFSTSYSSRIGYFCVTRDGKASRADRASRKLILVLIFIFILINSHNITRAAFVFRIIRNHFANVAIGIESRSIFLHAATSSPRDGFSVGVGCNAARTRIARSIAILLRIDACG